ncbi:MAG TPA: chloride channel protein [Candidatus Acidoferrum sp.]
MSTAQNVSPVVSVPEERTSAVAALSRRISAKFQYNEDRFFLILAVFIGIFAGLAVVCFRITMEWTRLFLLGSTLTPSTLRAFLAPSLTGLVISLLIFTIFKEARGSGLNQTKAALYISDGRISFRTVIGKFVTATLAIGSGHSLGPEDPSLQIGAGLASGLGRRLSLSRKKLRLLAPVGAAAGLAAAFNAPISAVLFVIEEIIGHWSAGILGAVVLSAVASVVTMRWFLGAEPFFRIPAVSGIRWEELAAYAVLGILGGLASVIFAKAIGWLRPRLKNTSVRLQFFYPAIAGLLIGFIAFAGFPQVMGAGYDYMDQAMHGQFTWQILGLLVLLKILATTLSFSSGTPGGMFAPTLFVGAMLGGAVGSVEHLLFPQLTGSIATYSLVGMGVLFAGFLRAPMTSVFMALEVSGDYSIILPVLVANTFSYLISLQLQRTPILELITRQDGLFLPALEEEREQEVLSVEDAMRPPAAVILDGEMEVAEAWEKAKGSADAYFLVHSEHKMWFVVAGEDLHRWAEGHIHHLLNDAVGNTPLPHLYPDQDLEEALRFASKWPLIPVLSRADISRLLGVIALADILEAFKNSATNLSPEN